MTIGPAPGCLACKHRHPPTGPYGDPETCAAFPDGIPAAIWDDGFDHRQPFPDDNGIRFEQRPDLPDYWAIFDELADEPDDWGWDDDDAEPADG